MFIKPSLYITIEEKIQKLINADLFKKNIKININRDNITKLSSFDIIPNLSLEERDYLISLSQYYLFITEPSCLLFLDKCTNIIEDDLKTTKNIPSDLIDILKNYTNDTSLFLSISILRSFYMQQSFYSEEELDYINSDTVLDFLVSEIRFFLIENKITLNNTKLRRRLFKTLVVLIEKTKDDTILRRTVQYTLKERKDIKTIVEWKINVKVNSLISTPINASLVKYHIIDTEEGKILMGSHFSKGNELYKKNFHSNENFLHKDLKILEYTLESPIYIDKEAIEIIKKKINEEESTEKIKIKIKILQKELKDISIKKRNDTTMVEISKKQKEISRLMEKVKIFFLLELKIDPSQALYLPIFYDFRGREYYKSFIGVTTNRLARYIYHYGFYKEDDFEKNKEIPELLIFKDKILEACEILNIEYNDKFYYIYFWLLIAIGQNLIIKNKVIITFEELIQESLKEFKNENVRSKTRRIDKEVELLYYTDTFKNLSYRMKKRIIWKDATCSVFQAGMVIHGPKNMQALEKVNMVKNNYIFDTYLFQKEKFYENYKEEINTLITEDEFNKFFSRSNIKKTIMTIPYSAGLKTCTLNFEESVLDEGLIINENVLKVYEIFYMFIKNKVEKQHFFKTSTKIMKLLVFKGIESKKILNCESETGKTNLLYSNEYSLYMDYKVNGKRITKIIKIPGDGINIKETKKAYGANIFHFVDSEVLRLVTQKFKFKYLTVHDAFGIELNKVNHLHKYISQSYTGLLKKHGVYVINSYTIVI